MGLFDIFRVGKIKAENDSLKQQLQELHADEYFQVKAHLDSMTQEIADNNALISKQHEDLSSLTEQAQKITRQLNTQTAKISRCKELYKSIEHALDNFIISDIQYNNCRLNPYDKRDLNNLAPSVSLRFHSLDVKELRKAYKDNEKQIDQLMDLYKARYTTKANRSIYSLIVIALRAELQNPLKISKQYLQNILKLLLREIRVLPVLLQNLLVKWNISLSMLLKSNTLIIQKKSKLVRNNLP